jgi:uroporphyrin-III C-methyltransferase
MSESRTVVLVVGHGSRREEANEDVRLAALRIGERGKFPLVVAAFLEIAKPTIAEGYAQLVAAGARHIIVHPYFLSPGRHTRGDIPVEVQAAANRHPDVTYQITGPLAAHPLVIDAAIERVRETVVPALSRLGKVYLVGAGPGDPGLLTVKASRLLRQADVIVYDYLVDPELLDHAAPQVERVYVGKVGRGTQTSQEQINRLLIERARRGGVVVRLKGGDPCLFGRGGDEALALRREGVPFEIVPGVSSALAAPTYAGIPLTHRGLSSSVAIVSAARAGDGEFSRELQHVNGADTLVILMGVAHLPRIAVELMAAGRSSETPVAVIRWGTYETQQTVTGTLLDIADVVERERLRAPAVIVVGQVVNLRQELEWFGIDMQLAKQMEVAA